MADQWYCANRKSIQKGRQESNRRLNAWKKKHQPMSTQERQEKARKAAARRKKK